MSSCTYVPLTESKLVAIYIRNAVSGILLLDTATNAYDVLPLGIVETEGCTIMRLSNTQFVIIGATPISPFGLYLVDITCPGEKKLLKSSASFTLPLDYLSLGEHISFLRTRGDFNLKAPAHAFFYRPENHDFIGPQGRKPPLLIWVHGGRKYPL